MSTVLQAGYNAAKAVWNESGKGSSGLDTATGAFFKGAYKQFKVSFIKAEKK